MSTTTENKGFSITRVFNAPRTLVFDAWTQPEHLAHWWGPKGFKVTVKSLDLRPGGVFLYGMTSSDGFEMWGKFVYQDIVKPERLVLINSFSDELGNATRHPGAPTWPLEMLNTSTFEETAGNKTTLMLVSVPYGDVTDEERETFIKGYASMTAGFGGTFDQLDAYLASLS